MSEVVAILLAAGESTRMGTPKALLPWQGATLLDHQILSLLQGGAERVVVVLGHNPEPLIQIVKDREGVIWTVNANYAQGKTTSIKAGLEALGPWQVSVILILNVDQPRDSSTVRGLLERHLAGGKQITIPIFGGKGGHPIALSPQLLPELLLISEATLGIKAVVLAHPDSTLRTEMPTAEVLWDLNTPEEYQRALRSQSRGD